MAQKATNNAAQLIAVEATSGAAGLVTWWQLGGGLSLEELAAEWARAGFAEDQLPKPVADTTALRRALVQLYPKADVIALPKVAGFAVALQGFVARDGEEQPDPVQLPQFKIWHDKEGVLKSAGEQSSPQLRRDVFRTMQVIQQTLEAHDLSGWLVRQAAKFHAVPLRAAGGVYFIPAPHVERWQKLAGIIEKCSKSSVWEIPALRTEKAVASILYALQHEVETEVERLEAKLNEGEMGLRALQARKRETQETLEKVAAYEKLLGKSLSALSESVEDINRKLTEAALMAAE